MASSFKNILIPVDFSINTEVAVKKGLELADNGTTIHLFHVQLLPMPGLAAFTGKYFGEDREWRERSKVKIKMQQWKAAIEDYRSDITCCSWITMGHPVQQAIEKKTVQLAIDLVIIGKQSHHSWLPLLNTVRAGKLAEHTRTPVLTVKPGAIYRKIKRVVIPVAGDALPEKLECLTTLCRKFEVQVYLVSFINEKGAPVDFCAPHLLHICAWLKSAFHCPVEYTVLHGRSRAKAILSHAEKIGADVVLLHPPAEARLGWTDRYISDMLPAASKLQVLAV